MSRANLIKRLEKATKPDRELDGDVAAAFGWSRPKIKGFCGDGFVGRKDYEWHDENGFSVGFYAPCYTASLDAAVSLVGRVLPGWHWTVSSTQSANVDDPRPYADVASPAWIREENTTEMAEARGATPAIALLIALLRADPTP